MVTKAKLAGPGQTWAAFSLGRSEYGRWLYAPAGTPVTATGGEQVSTLRLAGAQLVPADAWWVAWWWEDRTVTVDITTPASVKDREVTYTDLEIDLWANARGEHGIADLDEYDMVRAAGLITDDQHQNVQAAAADLHARLAQSTEPFGEVGWNWLTGVSRNQVNVVVYDPEWPRRFAAAREQIWPLLPAGSRVEHVGSTAVPGLAAKDIIDIAVVVPSLDDLEPAIHRLEAIGYQARRAAFDADPGHVFLRKLDDGRRSQHVHLYADGNPNLIEVVAVRDVLRSDAASRQRYQAVKLSLAKAAPYDLGAYVQGKNSVVQDLVQTARLDTVVRDAR
jgi:GrpB-like predicted nucleotidyltransferase (UPF0157 family)